MSIVPNSFEKMSFADRTPSSGELLRAALVYRQRGWSVLATIGKKSAHLWKKYQVEPADEPTLRLWFSQNNITGIAVILGGASGGLACRDFDTKESYERWRSDHPELAAVLPTVRTRRGYHTYLLGPAGYQDLGDGEYRADHKHYCLLPPSLHPEGAIYRWIIPLPAGDLPAIDPCHHGLLSPLHTQTQTHSCHPLHVSDRDIEDAITATLPTGPGQRNHHIWLLARHLKGIMPAATTESLEIGVRDWHTRALPFIQTKNWLTTWIDFRSAWMKVKKPIGAKMAEIVASATAQTPANADDITKLTILCRVLQTHHGPGKAWPLSCRVAGKHIGVSHETAAKLLKLLVAEQKIELVKPGGTKGSHMAAEYRLPIS